MGSTRRTSGPEPAGEVLAVVRRASRSRGLSRVPPVVLPDRRSRYRSPDGPQVASAWLVNAASANAVLSACQIQVSVGVLAPVRAHRTAAFGSPPIVAPSRAVVCVCLENCWRNAGRVTAFDEVPALNTVPISLTW